MSAKTLLEGDGGILNTNIRLITIMSDSDEVVMTNTGRGEDARDEDQEVLRSIKMGELKPLSNDSGFSVLEAHLDIIWDQHHCGRFCFQCSIFLLFYVLELPSYM